MVIWLKVFTNTSILIVFQAAQRRHIDLNWVNRTRIMIWTSAYSRVKTSKLQNPITTSTFCCPLKSNRLRKLFWRNAVKIKWIIFLIKKSQFTTQKVHVSLIYFVIKKNFKKIQITRRRRTHINHQVHYVLSSYILISFYVFVFHYISVIFIIN